MGRKISQEYFDATYWEYKNFYNMTPEEALTETVQQFTQEGADMSEVEQRPYEPTNVDPVYAAVHNLEHCRTEKYLGCLDKFEKLLKSDLSHRVYAAKNGAYEVLLDKLEFYNENEILTCGIIQSLTLLTDGDPNLLDKKGIAFIVEHLKERNHTVSKRLFQWTTNCCISHEKNRMDFIKAGLIDAIKLYLNDLTPTDTLQAACHLIVTMTHDYDIRVCVPDDKKLSFVLGKELLHPLSKCLSGN